MPKLGRFSYHSPCYVFLLLVFLLLLLAVPLVHQPVRVVKAAVPPAVQSNDISVEFVGSIGGVVSDSVISGNLAYLGEGTAVTVMDVTNPAEPVHLSRLPLPTMTTEIQVSGSRVFASTTEAIYIIDVSDPTRPTFLGSYSLSDKVIDIFAQDDLLYVTFSTSDMQIIDVSNPAAPALSGIYSTEHPANNVYVIDKLAYVTGDDGMHILDVSNPASLVFVGSYYEANGMHDVQVIGNLAYAIEGYGSSGIKNLHIIDVNNPMAPALVSLYDTPGSANGLHVVNDRAYIADWTGGLQIIDVSNPTFPSFAGVFNTMGASDVQVIGNLAYVKIRLVFGEDRGFEIVDVSNPTAPTLLGEYGPVETSGIDVVGNRAYVVAGKNLQIFDTSDPAAPILRNTYDTGIGSNRVRVADDFAYVTTWDGLQIANISNLSVPTFTGAYTSGADLENFLAVDVAGDIIYIAGYSGLHIVDVGNPTAPTATGTYAVPQKSVNLQAGGSLGPIARDVQVVDDLAYVAYEGLHIVDVSNPADPVLRGIYDTLALNIEVVDELAYVASGRDGLQIIDISNPISPVLRATYDTDALSVQVVHDIAYIATGEQGIELVDVSDPTNPVLLQAYDTPGTAFRLHVQDDLIYVVDDIAGLRILRVGGNASHAIYLPLIAKNTSSSSGITLSRCNDIYEPNDDPTVVAPFTVGNTQLHAFCVDDDVDWLAFEAAANTTYQIETSHLASDTDTVMELHDTDRQTVLALDDDGGEGMASLISFTFDKSGTYYIQLHQYNHTGDATYTYDVSIRVVDASEDHDFLERVVELTNQERAQQSRCAALTINTTLTRVAQTHSEDMALNDYFSHSSLDGSSPFDRMTRAGYQFSYAAENIAAGYTTPEQVVEGWMNSEGHRKNILNCNLEEIGVGHYYLENDTGNVNYRHYWTQVFGTSKWPMNKAQ